MPRLVYNLKRSLGFLPVYMSSTLYAKTRRSFIVACVHVRLGGTPKTR